MKKFIVLHVGFPKTGSSSIQEWLGASRDALRASGVNILTARGTSAGEIAVNPYRGGNVNSSSIVPLLRDKQQRYVRSMEFVDGLVRATEGWHGVVISAESLSQEFRRQDSTLLDMLDDVASSIDVRLIAYLRPQHQELAAAWCQWGFRSDSTPAEFIEHRAKSLHYDQILRHMDRFGRLDVVFRPYVQAELVDHDVVSDFAALLPCADEPPVFNVAANRSLPLAVANVLSVVDPTHFWRTVHDNSQLSRIKGMLADGGFDDARVEHGRDLLLNWCRERFGASNRAVISSLGWDPTSWPLGPGVSPVDLTRLNELWEPQASPAEIVLIESLLSAALGKNANDL